MYLTHNRAGIDEVTSRWVALCFQFDACMVIWKTEQEQKINDATLEQAEILGSFWISSPLMLESLGNMNLHSLKPRPCDTLGHIQRLLLSHTEGHPPAPSLKASVQASSGGHRNGNVRKKLTGHIIWVTVFLDARFMLGSIAGIRFSLVCTQCLPFLG